MWLPIAALVATGLVPSTADALSIIDYCDHAIRKMVLGRWSEAEALCNECLRFDPEGSAPYSCLSLVRLSQGDLEGARRHLDRALQLEPSSPDLHNNLGVLLMRQPPFRLSDAFAEFSKAIALDPSSEIARGNRAHCALELASRVARDSAVANSRAGLFRQARLDIALLNVSTSSATLEDLYGHLAMEEGRFAEAELHLLRYHALRPREQGTLTRLGSLYLAMGRCPEAVAAFRAELRRGPDTDVAAAARQSLEAACQTCGDACGGPAPTPEVDRSTTLRSR